MSGLAIAHEKEKEVIQANNSNSLSHTGWDRKYHIVFAPKYRRKVFYYEKEGGGWRNIKDIIRVEKGEDHRGGSMPGPHTVGRDTAESGGIKFLWIPEGKEQPDDL